MERKLIETIKAARRVSTPLLCVTTADQQAVVASICESINGAKGDIGDIDTSPPKISWDAVRGFVARNAAGNGALQQFDQGQDIATISSNPMEAIAMAAELPAKTILLWYNAHRFIGDAVVAQGIANLRDEYKQDRRTLILLAPSLRLPTELAADVVVLDDPLPDDTELSSVLGSVHEAGGIEVAYATSNPEIVDSATAAARGLSAFEAEQVFAMSLTKDGIDLDEAWERKIAAVNKTKGVEMVRGGRETFDTLGGLEQAKKFILQRIAGPNPPAAVVFIDEIEKSMAAVGTDTTGVSQDFHGAFLKWMEDNELDGMILVGPPGSGKTAFARAVGNSAGIPTITWDLGAMKGSLVGESESAIREAQKISSSVGGGRILVIATCNKLDVLPPELRRRFTSGIWYFDLPTKEERKGIWQIHAERYNIKGDPFELMPDDTDWTGAEIRNACKIAWQLETTLEKAADYIVPVAKANPDSIKRLRDAATGRWLSASYPGPFRQQFSTGTARSISVDPGMN